MFTDDTWDVVQRGCRPTGHDLATLLSTEGERPAAPEHRPLPTAAPADSDRRPRPATVLGGASWTP
jgi:hypothetical protein